MSKSFSLFEMDSLLRAVGAQRVEESASRKLAEILEDDAREILRQAKLLARHAGRKNIVKKDVVLASRCCEKHA